MRSYIDKETGYLMIWKSRTEGYVPVQFDKEDLEKVKKYEYHVNSNGDVLTVGSNPRYLLEVLYDRLPEGPDYITIFKDGNRSNLKYENIEHESKARI